MKAHQRNSLYTLLENYLTNQVDVAPRHAWAHFTSLAHQGFIPALVAYDGEAIEIRPDMAKVRTKRVNRGAFTRQLQKIRRELLAMRS